MPLHFLKTFHLPVLFPPFSFIAASSHVSIQLRKTADNVGAGVSVVLVLGSAPSALGLSHVNPRSKAKSSLSETCETAKNLAAMHLSNGHSKTDVRAGRRSRVAGFKSSALRFRTGASAPAGSQNWNPGSRKRNSRSRKWNS
jgi:hypothetical protein